MKPGGDLASAKRPWLFIGIAIGAAIVGALMIWLGVTLVVQHGVQGSDSTQSDIQAKSTVSPQLSTEVVVEGYSPIWDVAFLPTKEMIFNERKGVINILKDGHVSVLQTITDVNARGEGGLMGLAVDPAYASNRFIYACFNSTRSDIRVVRWRVSDNSDSLESRADIVTGMPTNASGRHSGCRIAFGPDSYLWIGTGDTAQGDTAIQPKSLGGKILRVDRDGKPAPGNIGGEFDNRVYSYGHRNVQGLAFFENPKHGIIGVSTEHGSNVDDEVNPLRLGNFGWAPSAKGYDESVPMTDKKRFPDAIEALWSSGDPTDAISGATFLSGNQWKAWEGSLAVTALKAEHLKIIDFNTQGTITNVREILKSQFGRLRTAVQGPDGNLYIATDNGTNNQIIRITPH